MDQMNPFRDLLRHLRDSRSLNSSLSEENEVTGLVSDPGNFDQRIGGLFDRFSTLVTNERSLIDQERRKLMKEQEDFEAEKQAELDRFESARKEWEREKTDTEQKTGLEGNVFEINVGGQATITTTKTTLTKVSNSALAALFSGRHRIPTFQGQVFIDRDPVPFCHMISFLRTGKVPGFKSTAEEIEFLDELDFWKITLEEDRSEEQRMMSFDPAWVANTLALECDNTVLRKLGPKNGTAFTSLPLTHRDPYVEFLISITDPAHTGGSHVFVGVVNRSKYVVPHLQSTHWKDAPSSWYWDVWSSKLIRTDENGTHTQIKGYGCNCEDDESEIGIYFDYKTGSISFYKDGLCQGVAFTNVPPGLYPSIDVWFEQGTVAIKQTKVPRQKIYM